MTEDPVQGRLAAARVSQKARAFAGWTADRCPYRIKIPESDTPLPLAKIPLDTLTL